MTDTQKAYLQFHLAVLLWGFTAILGDLIALSALVLVWWRVGLSGIGLSVSKDLQKNLSAINKGDLRLFIFVGVIVALHWVCFYGSIKLANASIALVTMSTTAFFTLIFESWATRDKMKRTDILFGVAIVPPMVLISNGIQSSMVLGLIVGILAALLLALFTVMNKKLIRRADPISITFIEMSVSWVFLGVVILLSAFFMKDGFVIFPSSKDWFWLVLLAGVCTILPFILSLYALRHLTAFVTNMIFNLEPVYGMILAAVLLKDYQELNWTFYTGGVIIVILVLCHPMIKNHHGSIFKS